MDTTPLPPNSPEYQAGANALRMIFTSKTPQLVPSNLAATLLPANLLTEADTVEKASEAIVAIQDHSARTGAVVNYPRNLLKVQHLVAFLLVNPFAMVGEVCRFFSISPNTYATLTKSDAFRQLMETHGAQILKEAPQELTEKMKDTLHLALDKTQAALLKTDDGEFALSAVDKLANRMGMGVKHQAAVQINNNIITADMIHKAKAKRLPPAPSSSIIDVKASDAS